MVWKLFRQQKQKRPDEGQAIVEFALGLMMVISFFFFYVKLAAVFAIGNYIHYATFMAARAYHSSAASEPEQKANAEAVLNSMIAGRWKKIFTPVGGDTVKGATIGSGIYFADNPFINSWNQGVSFHFKSSLELYPWNRVASPIELDLTSDSWLGREQPSDECRNTKAKIRGLLKGATVFWDDKNDC